MKITIYRNDCGPDGATLRAMKARAMSGESIDININGTPYEMWVVEMHSAEHEFAPDEIEIIMQGGPR